MKKRLKLACFLGPAVTHRDVWNFRQNKNHQRKCQRKTNLKALESISNFLKSLDSRLSNINARTLLVRSGDVVISEMINFLKTGNSRKLNL